MDVAKTKALISFAVTAKLICVFVFAYAKCWFSHDAAQMVSTPQPLYNTIHNTVLDITQVIAGPQTVIKDIFRYITIHFSLVITRIG